MRKTITTPWEVVKYSPARDKYSTVFIGSRIPSLERKIFKQYFTMDLYAALINDLIDYSDVDQWKASVTYVVGDVVVGSDNFIYISLENGNTFQPDNENYWELAPKFGTDCFQDIWCDGLREGMAYFIMKHSLRYSTYQASSKGLVVYGEADDTREKTVDARSFELYVKNMHSDALELLQDARDLMEEREDCFSSYFEPECDVDTKKNTRRDGLRRILMR